MRASASAPARHLRFRSILGWYQISNQLLRSASAIAIRGGSSAVICSIGAWRSASVICSIGPDQLRAASGSGLLMLADCGRRHHPIGRLVLTNGKARVFANERGRRSGSRCAGRHRERACTYCLFIGIAPPLELGVLVLPPELGMLMLPPELGMLMLPPEPCIIMLPPAAAPPGAGAP